MKTLYKFHFECGRAGTLYGTFIEDSQEVEALVKSGEVIYFGELLGKHSEISGPLERCDFTLISYEQDFVEQAEKFGICVGYNPLDFYRNQTNE